MNKKILLITAVSFTIIIFAIILYFALSNKNTPQSIDNTPQVVNEDENSLITPDNSTQKTSNPFMPVEDINAVNESYEDQYSKEGLPEPTKPTYDFKYEIDPALSDPRSFNIIRQVHAANRCNLDPLPQSLPIYLLKAHIDTSTASYVASKFSIVSPPSSLPSDGGTFQYFFTDDYSTGFLSIFESSGSYLYHKVPGNLGATLDSAVLRVNAQSVVQTYGFTDLSIESEILNGDISAYRFRKKWGQYKITDKLAIQSLGNLPLCEVSDALGMNYLEIHLRTDGTLSRFINQSREPLKKIDMRTISFVQAFQKQNRSFIDPIVVPQNSATQGTVLIDEVMIVYYDFGNVFPQQAYIPMYLTKGSIAGTNTSVYSFIPAVDENELVQSGLLSLQPAGSVGDTSQKQTTFYYVGASKQLPPTANPPKPKTTIKPTTYVALPTPTDIPQPTDPLRSPTPTRTPAPTKTPTPTSVLHACPLQSVDYNARCTKDGVLLCLQSTIIDKKVSLASASSMNPNPINVCNSGCISISKSFSNVEGQDPCKRVLDEVNVTIKNYQDFKKGLGYPSGNVSCSIDACPC